MRTCGANANGAECAACRACRAERWVTQEVDEDGELALQAIGKDGGKVTVDAEALLANSGAMLKAMLAKAEVMDNGERNAFLAKSSAVSARPHLYLVCYPLNVVPDAPAEWIVCFM